MTVPGSGPEPGTHTTFRLCTAGAGTLSVPYAVYEPPRFGARDRWPIILFLHGAGERGRDGLRQTMVGLGPALLEHPDRYPAVVVLPQCPRGLQWDGPAAAVALQALDDTIAGGRIDDQRLYITGISMGGYGTFVIASLQPERFAAALPICGWGAPPLMGPPLASLPMWIIHGDADEIIPVDASREMVAAIRSAGNTRVRYTEYKGVAHNSWDRAYGDPAVPSWLFDQVRDRPTATSSRRDSSAR